MIPVETFDLKRGADLGTPHLANILNALTVCSVFPVIGQECFGDHYFDK